VTVVITPGKPSPVFFDFVKSEVSVGIGGTDVIDVEVGTSGKPGPKGPEGGTPVVALPYDQWPPVDPQPDTLYLRLAP
jgi:hypothetical protein